MNPLVIPVPITGLICKAVKTYFDRKAVKTRLKPVKTGLNRSKRGQNLKLRNTCQGSWKNPVRWIYICNSVYGLCILNRGVTLNSKLCLHDSERWKCLFSMKKKHIIISTSRLSFAFILVSNINRLKKSLVR